MASGYLTMFKVTGDKRYKDKAIACLDWLIEHKSPKFIHYSWANHFAFASRGGKYEKHDSIIVWTALIGQTFLDAYEILNKPKYLEIAKSVCSWILELPREETTSGSCLSYLAFVQSSVHNSNILGATMLARTAILINDKAMLEVARDAINYSCTRQLSSGAWYYGEADNMHWIDNFHTGYNLDNLKCYIECTGDNTFISNLHRGYEFFKNTFFENNGRPKYYHNRVYPVDSQCAAQAIETLANFSDYDSTAIDLALKVANWTIENMQDDEGYFYYRQYPGGIKAKTPMLHWAQATTYKALSRLLLKLT
jgi:rhamnogalacturonyl hydrolase YesR